MKTIDYCRAVKKKLGISSDYELAKRLGLGRSAISNYVNGLRAFDPAIALKIADILELPRERVFADVEAERTSSPELQEVWKRIARKVAIVAGVGAGTALLAHLARSSGADPHQVLEAMSVLAMPLASPVYYVNYAPALLAVALIGLTLAALARARLFPPPQRLTAA